MLTLTDHEPASGRGTPAVVRDTNAFHEAALAMGLNVTTTPQGDHITVTGDSRGLAALYAEGMTGGIPRVTVSSSGDDSETDLDIFRATLTEVGIDANMTMMRE